ncbi:MAG: aminoacyl-tRNA hydrolase [Candidatus Omnitrophica bacterium]|nr:aminoacyl-tRNA hydrolase [Candidatus Omnitrophota bacterium]
MADTCLIVGLGNPEEKYRWTRHNWGFLVVEKLAADWGIKFKRDDAFKGLVAKYVDCEKVCYLLLPLTYMNLSGQAVGLMFERKSLALAHMLVVCDDLDLPFGQVRLRAKGSAGGHNGLKSIIGSVNSSEFPRLRGGIGRPTNQSQTVDFVLDQFNKEEQGKLESYLKTAVECCQVWVKHGVDEAMSQFNKRKDDE